MKKNKIMRLSALALLTFVCLGQAFNTRAAEPPASINKNDGGHQIGSTFISFSYQLRRTSYDPITERAQYKIGQYFDISGAPIAIYSDYLYVTNSLHTNYYVGYWSKHNGSAVAPGTYRRDKWLNFTLVPGRNVITLRGDSSGVAGTGDAQFVVNIDRFGHDPVVHGVNGTWTAGEVSSNKRTWESLYSDGATGSAEGNKQPTATGFTYTDTDEQTTPVGAYANVPISANSRITEIKKQTSSGAWVTISNANWKEMDNVGLYWLKSCTTDQANNTTCGTRYVNVKQKKYNVKYNGNGATSGTMANSEHTYDEAKQLNQNEYARTNHTWIGWNTKSDGTGTSYSDRQSVKNLTDTDGAIVNLYAQWDKAPTITASNKTYYDSEHTQKEWVDTLRMKNVTATDQEDGKLTSKIAIISDNTVMDKPGTYQVTYQVTDSVGNVTNKTTTVTIKHNNPPVISANNKSFYYDEYTLTQWQNQERMKNVTANDTEDGNITSKVKILSDNVDPTIPGYYQVTYTVTDSHKKMSTKTIDVEVLYNHAPVIDSFSFSFHENAYSDDEWKEEFMKQVTATDQEDGNLTDDVTIKSSNVNPEVPGAYEVVLTVTDSRGKTTNKTVDVTVLENWQPTIQIFAGNKRFIEGQYTQDEWKSELRMLGVNAHDREDANLTDQIVIVKDTTNPSKSGLYQVTYKVSDRWGKTAEKTVSVIVEPNDPPQIFAYDKYFTTNDEINEDVLLKNIVSVDDHDGDVSDKVTIKDSNVKSGKPGDYEVTYTVTDRFGKKTDKTINVHVRESGGIPVNPNPPITFDPEALGIWNGRALGNVNITKLMETSIFGHDKDAYKDVVFGIYADEDIVYQNEIVLKAGSLVSIATVDEQGQLNAILYHRGKYILKELETNKNYTLSDKEYHFEFK